MGSVMNDVRKIGVSFMFAVALAGLSGCDSAEDRVSGHYQRGMELLESGEPEKATLEFRSALRIDENHAPSRLEIAKLYEQGGDLRAAVGNYRLVAELGDDELESRLRLAEILLAAGDGETALRYAEEAVGIAPKDPRALAGRAAAKLAGRELEAAQADAEAALAVDPDNTTANIVAVSVLMEQGAYDEALRRSDALLERDPKSFPINLLKLQILEHENRSEEVMAHLAVMMARFPEAPQLRIALVQAKLRANDLEGAEAVLRQTADAAPQDADRALELIKFLLQTQGADAARAEMEKRLETAEPDGIVANRIEVALADLDRAMGDADAARKRLERLAEGSDPEAAARLRLAQMALDDKDPAGARAIAEDVLEEDDTNIKAIAMRTRALIAEEDPEAALASVRKALDLDPDNAVLLLLAAQAYERQGNMDLAGDQLAGAMRSSNYDPEVSISYARFLIGRDQTRAAETVLSEANRRHPENRDVLSALAELRVRLEDWVGAEGVVAQLRELGGSAAIATRIEAAALRAQGRMEESIGVLQSQNELDGEAGIMVDLVTSYARAGEMDKAVAFVDDILTKQPDNLAAIALRAELHLVVGEADAAEALLRKIVEKSPNAPTGYLALARLHFSRGDGEAGDAAIEQGLAATGGDPALQRMKAGRLEALGDIDGALAVYEALYRETPGALVIANNYASLLADHRADDPESRRQAISIARRLRGSDTPYYQDTYGWSLYLSEAYEDALGSLIGAAEALPDNPVVRYHLGAVYAKLGQNKEARRELEAALSIDSDFSLNDAARAVLDALPQEGSD